MARIPPNDSPTADLRGSDGPAPGGARMRAILVLAATLAFVLSPALTGGFAGFDPSLFPVPQDRPPVQPAGYAFAIWGLIYAWLIVSAGYGLLARADAPDWDAARWPLLASLVPGAGWIAAANASAVLATVLIWVMLLAALVALARAPVRDRWLCLVPLAIYAGWLTAASWVSVGLMLGGYGVTGPQAAALIAVPLAVGFALAVQLRLGRAPEYAATVIWALVAVVVANLGTGWLLPGLGVAGIAAMAWSATRARRGAPAA